jgi:hypothetical protein
LQRHREHHLANARSVLGAVVTARAIDVSDQIELLGHPQQCADITDRTRADRPRVTEVRLERRVHGTQDHLARDRAALRRIPDRLGRHPVPVPAHLTLEEVHLSHVYE